MTVLPVQNLFFVPQPRSQTDTIWRNAGWEVQSVQPPHPNREKRGGAMSGMDSDEGIEAREISTFFMVGHQIQPWQPPSWPRLNRPGAIMRGDDGVEQIKLPWLNFGYLVQEWQPPHRASERKFAAFAPDDDGTYGPKYNWLNFGYPIQSWQPPHPNREKFGAIITDEDGSENPMPSRNLLVPDSEQFVGRSWTRQRYAGIKGKSVFGIIPDVFLGWGFGSVEPITRSWTTIRQRGAAAYGESNFAIFNMTPWHDNQAWQPYHFKYARAGIMDGDAGFYKPAAVPPTWGFEHLLQPPHIRWERAGAVMRGDDGTELPKINWLNFGYLVAEPPPPHKPIEKRGAIVPKDDGNQFPPIRFLGFGFHVQPWQPPHRAPELKFAAMARGDDGTQAGKINFLTYGWPIQPWQPPHPRPERGAAFLHGDDGNENIYVFVPPPVTTIVRDPDIPREVWRKYRKRIERLEAARQAQERAEDRARTIKRKALRELVLGVTESAHDVLIAAEEARADVGASPLISNLNMLANARSNRELEKLALQTERMVQAFYVYIKDIQDDEDDLEVILSGIL